MKLFFPSGDHGPNIPDDDDTSPTQPLERPSFAANVKFASETQIRCAVRYGHMTAAAEKKRRAK